MDQTGLNCKTVERECLARKLTLGLFSFAAANYFCRNRFGDGIGRLPFAELLPGEGETSGTISAR
jgi:hypothetical protein